MVVDSAGKPLVWLLKNRLNIKLMEQLADDVWNTDFKKLARRRGDSRRGEDKAVNLGIWQRRGGDVSFHKTPESKTKQGTLFIKKYGRVWSTVRQEMKQIDPSYARAIGSIPGFKPDLGMFHYGMVHFATGDGMEHVDPKDFRWSVSLPFGHFEGGNLYFPYLGVEIEARSTDIVVFKSNLLYHNVSQVTSGKRGSVVLVNHRRVLFAAAEGKKIPS